MGLAAEPEKTAPLCRRGVRVAGMHRESDDTWTLLGVGGAAAYHDTAEVTTRGVSRAVVRVSSASRRLP